MDFPSLPGPIDVIDWVLGRDHPPSMPDMPDVRAPQAPPTGFQGADAQRAQYRDRAMADYGAIQSKLILDGGEQLTAKELSSSNGHSTVWPHGQLVAAALDRALISGDVGEATKALKGLDRYLRDDGTFNPNEGHGGGDRFYDDNAWIGLDFVQAFKLTGDQKYIDGARRVFEFLEKGRHPDGGIRWKEGVASRNAASNGPAEQLALHLNELTGEQKYLDFAKDIDRFENSKLRRADGLIDDNIGDDGGVDHAIWSYNQGTSIGADLQMYRATKDQKYLERAKATAQASLRYFGEDDRLWKQPPAFNAIFFRNLMQLDAVAPDPAYRATLERYLERARTSARGGDGLYAGNGIGRYVDDPDAKGTPVIDQSAFVQMHSLLAMTPEQLASVS